jgi:hypothetical protein
MQRKYREEEQWTPTGEYVQQRIKSDHTQLMTTMTMMMMMLMMMTIN